MQSVACFTVRSREFFYIGDLDALLPGSGITDGVLAMLDATRDAFERGFVSDNAIEGSDDAFRALCDAAPTAAEILPHLDALTAVHAVEILGFGDEWEAGSYLAAIGSLREAVIAARPGERFLFVSDSAHPSPCAARFGFRRVGHRNQKHVSVVVKRDNSTSYGRILGERMVGRDAKGVPIRRVRVLLDDGTVATWRTPTTDALFSTSDATKWRAARARRGVWPSGGLSSWMFLPGRVDYSRGVQSRIVLMKHRSVGPSEWYMRNLAPIPNCTGDFEVTVSASVGGP